MAFHSVKQHPSDPQHDMLPQLDIPSGESSVYGRPVVLPLQSNPNVAARRRRLVSFGTIILALSSYLWFSVYQRHSYLGFTDDEDSFAKRGPWMILALVLLFLGFAAICAGISIRNAEEESRVRVVRGDSVLGMIAEHDRSAHGWDYTEPTTPQRVWAVKAIAEMDRL